MIITKTPFRVSFAGGGTDIRDYYKDGYGAVLSIAISKYMYITVNKRFEDSIRVSYSQTEIVDDVKDIRHELVKECLKLTNINKGIEITSIADVPSGTGLGSSSCFTVGLLNALFTYTGQNLSGEELANLACKIEIDTLGHPIGKQDQYACACGGVNYFRFNADETVEREKIFFDEYSMRDLNRKFMLFYTGMRRNANEVLKDQKRKTEAGRAVLDKMRDQADALKDDFTENGFTKNIAKILHEGWKMKSSLSEKISNSALDNMYLTAIEAGALGGKVLGAGGGGFLLVYCDEPYQDAVRNALGLKEMEVRVSEYGSRVVYFG